MPAPTPDETTAPLVFVVSMRDWDDEVLDSVWHTEAEAAARLADDGFRETCGERVRVVTEFRVGAPGRIQESWIGWGNKLVATPLERYDEEERAR